jgi:hypothetical protein
LERLPLRARAFLLFLAPRRLSSLALRERPRDRERERERLLLPLFFFFPPSPPAAAAADSSSPSPPPSRLRLELPLLSFRECFLLLLPPLSFFFFFFRPPSDSDEEPSLSDDDEKEDSDEEDEEEDESLLFLRFFSFSFSFLSSSFWCFVCSNRAVDVRGELLQARRMRLKPSKHHRTAQHRTAQHRTEHHSTDAYLLLHLGLEPSHVLVEEPLPLLRVQVPVRRVPDDRSVDGTDERSTPDHTRSIHHSTPKGHGNTTCNGKESSTIAQAGRQAGRPAGPCLLTG